jgi:hypothetical protein
MMRPNVRPAYLSFPFSCYLVVRHNSAAYFPLRIWFRMVVSVVPYLRATAR